MSTNDRNPDKQLQRLTNALIEDILEATDDEIIEEAKEDYGNPKTSADEVRLLFHLAKTNTAKTKLRAAKYNLEASRTTELKKILPFDMTEARNIVTKFAANDSDLQGKLTMAARMGEELSDQDIQGIIEDLIELGVLHEDGSERSKL